MKPLVIGFGINVLHSSKGESFDVVTPLAGLGLVDD
jgi:hypothetical protein